MKKGCPFKCYLRLKNYGGEHKIKHSKETKQNIHLEIIKYNDHIIYLPEGLLRKLSIKLPSYQ